MRSERRNGAAPGRPGQAKNSSPIADGRLDIAITEVGSLAEAPAAQQLLAQGRGRGKYVTRVSG